MLLSVSRCVALPLGPRAEPQGCNAPGHKFNIQTMQAQCVSDQLSGLPAVPNLPQEPLTPPVVNRMDAVFVVLVEGKALHLMTLRSPGLLIDHTGCVDSTVNIVVFINTVGLLWPWFYVKY